MHRKQTLFHFICLLDDKVSIGSSLVSNNNSEPENDKCRAKKKNEGKKKAKVDKKEKRLKDKNAEKTKSKKFHRRLVSLFCCCFNSQERNDQNANRAAVHREDTSFATIDWNN